MRVRTCVHGRTHVVRFRSVVPPSLAFCVVSTGCARRQTVRPMNSRRVDDPSREWCLIAPRTRRNGLSVCTWPTPSLCCCCRRNKRSPAKLRPRTVRFPYKQRRRSLRHTRDTRHMSPLTERRLRRSADRSHRTRSTSEHHGENSENKWRGGREGDAVTRGPTCLKILIERRGESDQGGEF